jgi:hypothetical protein
MQTRLLKSVCELRHGYQIRQELDCDVKQP